MYGLIFSLVLVLLMHLCNGQQNTTEFTTPEYIKPCPRNHPQINTCLLGTFEHLRPYLVKGIKDIDVPSIDPFMIDKLAMENGQGPFKIKALYSNVTARGGSNYTIQSIKADIKHYTIEIAAKLPRIDIHGKYDVAGNVLLFTVRSKGEFWSIFANLDIRIVIYGKEVIKNNIKYMKIARIGIDLDVGRSRFRIRDIVNHGNILGEVMNQFLNSNSADIINELKPAASASISKHFKMILNNALARLPLQVWLPDS